ncbi:MAG: glycosyltransferase family 4 protein [Myxococcota bacterium]
MDLEREGRILYISPADVSVGSGPGVNENEFVHAMHAALGDRAQFLVPQPSEAVDDLPAEALHFCTPHRRYHPLHFPRHVVSQIRAANRLLREQHFDLLVFRIDVFPFVPFYLTARHRLPYAIKTLGTGALNVLHDRAGLLGDALAPVNQAMFRRLVSRALAADTDSVLHAEELRRRLGQPDEQVVWIDNAVNTGRFRPSGQAEARRAVGLEAFDPIVGYVGSRPWERGGAQLVEAAARLLPKHPRLGVVVVGAGEPVAKLRERAAALGIAEHCRFPGYVPYRQIPAYVRSLDVGVSLSLQPERQMNSELKVRQYLAAGKPIVISPGSNEFVVEQGFGSVVPPEDIDGITDAIGAWLDAPAAEREAFANRTAAYMHEHLSMAAAIARRLRLWGERVPA